MDHDHDHGGSDSDDGSRTCPMIMTFHAGHCEKILWKGWLAYTVTEFVFSAIAIFFMAFLYEALKFGREVHLRRSLKHHSISNDGTCSSTPLVVQQTVMQRLVSSTHLIQSLLNLVQIVLSYLLMLIFMTFNYWLCLAVILGLGVGYFCFGWIKQQVYDNECCH